MRSISNPQKVVFFSILITIGLVSSCIEPFSPPEVNDTERYLVVDGFLNVGGDTSIVELRRTQNTNGDTFVNGEAGAKLVAESESGETFPFNEGNDGRYVLPPVAFNPGVKYRLNIRTGNGSEYVSDYVKVTQTPAIDSITYRYDPGRDAVIVNVNTHDASNNTRFYRWKFEETYEYRSAFYSGLVRDLATETIVPRYENINLCWKTQQSGDIKLGSTIKLSEDVIKNLPINIIPVESNKLYYKYSILIKQYGLSQEAFEYWTSLAKTTQGTGSLFDPQPSQVTGNIKNVSNPKELVFGYFSASTESRQRIFIKDQYGSSPRCQDPDTLKPSEAYGSGAVLLNTFIDASGATFILGSSEFCSDCRVQGGNTKRPPFWE